MSSSAPVSNDQSLATVVGVHVIVRRRKQMTLVHSPDLERVRDSAARSCRPELFDDTRPIRLVHTSYAKEDAAGLTDDNSEAQSRRTEVRVSREAHRGAWRRDRDLTERPCLHQ